MVQQWPLTVGLYIPPSVKSRVLVQAATSVPRIRSDWKVPAGDEAAATFRWALERMFAKVVVVDESPSERVIPGGLAGVIELSDISIGPHVLIFESGLYSGKGDKIDSWQISSPIISDRTELAYVMSDVIAQFMVRFPDRPAVKSWLAGQGIAEVTVRPFFSNDDAARPSGSRILLAPILSHSEAKLAMSCLGNRLAHTSPPFNLATVDSIRLEIFPWLEPSLAPKTSEDVQRWLADDAIQKRLWSVGVRYLLEFHGETKTDMPDGGMLCGGGFGAGGCFGYSSGTRESSFNVTLLDLRDRGKPLDTSVTERGGVYIPAFILPIPFIAATETKACDDLASRIHEMLKNRQNGESR